MINQEQYNTLRSAVYSYKNGDLESLQNLVDCTTEIFGFYYPTIIPNNLK